MKVYKINRIGSWGMKHEVEDHRGIPMMKINKQSAFSNTIDIITGSNAWVCSNNTWMNKFTIENKRGETVGEMKKNSWNQQITFNYKNREYRFKKYHWASSAYIWESGEGQKMMSFKPKYFSKTVATVRVYNNNMDRDLKEIMLSIGWHAVKIAMSQG